MKKLIFTSTLLIMLNLCFAQDKPKIKYVSATKILGTCNNGSVIHVEFEKNSDKSIVVEKTNVFDNGNFVFSFTTNEVRKKGDKVRIWATYNKRFGESKKDDSDSEIYLVEDDSEIIIRLANEANKKTERESNLDSILAKINILKTEKKALRNTTLTYKTSIWSTNFNIPLVRFNRVENDDTKHGDILVFNSIGAGLGYYLGRLERTRDDRGEIINEEFSNSFGITIGALFSAGTGEDTKNVFAPTLNISTLDFQIGYGYELGTLSQSQRRGFFTLSYAIPLYKLFKKSYRVSRSYLIPIELSEKSQN